MGVKNKITLCKLSNVKLGTNSWSALIRTKDGSQHPRIGSNSSMIFSCAKFWPSICSSTAIVSTINSSARSQAKSQIFSLILICQYFIYYIIPYINSHTDGRGPWNPFTFQNVSHFRKLRHLKKIRKFISQERHIGILIIIASIWTYFSSDN